MGTVVEVTRAELENQRAALLAQARMPWERLVELGGAYALDAEERNIYESIRAINFLLEDD